MTTTTFNVATLQLRRPAPVETKEPSYLHIRNPRAKTMKRFARAILETTLNERGFIPSRHELVSLSGLSYATVCSFAGHLAARGVLETCGTRGTRIKNRQKLLTLAQTGQLTETAQTKIVKGD